MCQIRSAWVSLPQSLPVDAFIVMRKRCPKCSYPVQTCLCHAVQSVANHTEVIILQHPKESVHAKNTVRLLSLSLANITTWVGKTAADFIELQHYLAITPAKTAVIYPSEYSVELPRITNNHTYTIERVIFIDASWKQAFGIWQNNLWLNEYPFYKLPPSHTGQYTIRRSHLDYSLSTLEAVALTLEYTEQLDTTPLLTLLNSFTKQWQGFVPPTD